jgi:hypothetical protein
VCCGAEGSSIARPILARLAARRLALELEQGVEELPPRTLAARAARTEVCQAPLDHRSKGPGSLFCADLRLSSAGLVVAEAPDAHHEQYSFLLTIDTGFLPKKPEQHTALWQLLLSCPYAGRGDNVHGNKLGPYVKLRRLLSCRLPIFPLSEVAAGLAISK